MVVIGGCFVGEAGAAASVGKYSGPFFPQLTSGAIPTLTKRIATPILLIRNKTYSLYDGGPSLTGGDNGIHWQRRQLLIKTNAKGPHAFYT